MVAIRHEERVAVRAERDFLRVFFAWKREMRAG
jgi:hypothetical protein